LITVGRGTSQERKEAKIELATKIIDDVDRLHSTLLHEMVHAAAWLIDGISKPAHGACFKKWANIAMRKVRRLVLVCRQGFALIWLAFVVLISLFLFCWSFTVISRCVDPRSDCHDDSQLRN